MIILHYYNSFVYFLTDFDMKKDIDTLIAEERAEIISKYDKVSLCTGIPSPNSDNTQDLYDKHR